MQPEDEPLYLADWDGIVAVIISVHQS